MPTQRIHALDAFRGLQIALLIIGCTPGSFEHVYPQLVHAPWTGCTFADFGFPAFLFIVGASCWVSGEKRGFVLNHSLLIKILRRTLLLFLIGILVNAFPFYNPAVPFSLEAVREHWAHLRLFGILQRIGLAYGLGYLLCLLLQTRGRILLAGLGLLLFSWGAMVCYHPQAPYAFGHNLSQAVDRICPGEAHCYSGFSRPLSLREYVTDRVDATHILLRPAPGQGLELRRIRVPARADVVGRLTPAGLLLTVPAGMDVAPLLAALRVSVPFDPEGLFGTINASVTVLIGFLAAGLLFDKKRDWTCAYLGSAGALIGAGLLFGHWTVLSKPLWSSAYVLLTGGAAMLAFWLFVLLEQRGWVRLFRPLESFGANPLLLFVTAILVARSLRLPWLTIHGLPVQPWLWETVFRHLGPANFASLLYALLYALLFWLLAERLYQKIWWRC